MYKNFSNQTVSSFDLLKEREIVAAVAHFSLLTGKEEGHLCDWRPGPRHN